ncbi:alpha/beta fold hydrolase [Agromyces protaetiae]|uniref:Alpha/beta fold hydrolase n=1 Tax=Agromyces protaetiae TaxID=2509455 RepID=A0A4P6FAL4_9MICO|nr:alpha/beta fold hydrolase [Agromyces protaetiae]QAY72666.1 alpha/beta fold hydrolase [Agromyces protaetiae]
MTDASATRFAVDNEFFDAQTLRAASTALFGGADLVECTQIARRVRADDLTSWHDEWQAAAERAYALAEDAERSGQRETARLAFLRASTYFRSAGSVFLAKPVDPRLVDSIERQRDAFRRAIAHFTTPVEPVEIPFEGITMPGYHYRVADDGMRRPTIILVNGYDGTVEELYSFNAAAALARGYDVLAFEGPGQGSVLVEQGLTLRPDWEHVVAPVVDWLLDQPTVDPDRIALVGLSLGGYLAPRAASGEHRLAACISDSGFYDMALAAAGHLPKGVRDDFPDGTGLVEKIETDAVLRMVEHLAKQPTAGWTLRRGLYVNGADTYADYFRDTRRYTLVGYAEQIRCPTLVCRAENDPITTTAPDLYGALTCPKAYLEFTVAEGAGQHCEVGARQLYYARAFGWLDGILHPERVGAA